MNRIIERLEQHIANQGLTVLEKFNDGFTYAIAIRSETSVFVVYTTKSIFHFREKCCLRVFELTEHIRFNTVDPWPGGDFIMPYTQAVTRSGKCLNNYDCSFTLAEVALLLNL